MSKKDMLIYKNTTRHFIKRWIINSNKNNDDIIKQHLQKYHEVSNKMNFKKSKVELKKLFEQLVEITKVIKINCENQGGIQK
ncbi:hypothetical protein [Heyndrickxia sporothermodurans]|uniref:Uncharacterized protein n=1 Tax=Heyndrickxia sporothermodurans TaxID=46224 RepID=A0AB37HD07_9BACI|nr:hypothetical protein [Heyndrickxia sporothermodurans]MBL5769032.1 hypothetical protein [Heyndrickxia sporothermodurans]MBL5772729.1 hypothetical protein [Heyndrickxia sporothermodurans]MBL5783431.1 hypothetical protein [Heyndrickxia sporothermodurans]MBL5786905.1 hypothetical protein [Heyndrickxia sporothermodurans]MBL5790444.1 hypothetical protein [Heyndrickxia sporothermodurans]